MPQGSTNIVIVVQARMSSSRLPGKVLMPILGESLLYRMIERLKMIRHEAQLVIAIPFYSIDDVIVKEAENMGVPCFRGSLNNVLERHYQAGLKYNADI